MLVDRIILLQLTNQVVVEVMESQFKLSFSEVGRFFGILLKKLLPFRAFVRFSVLQFSGFEMSSEVCGGFSFIIE